MKKDILPTFTKEALVKSERYKDKRDLVNALLDKDEEYTVEQVDGLIHDYMTKEVK